MHVIAHLSTKSTSARTLAISELKLVGRIPAGYELYTESESAGALCADTFRPVSDMQSATAQTTTTNIIVNIRRFIDYPSSELWFGVLLQQPKCWLCP